MSKQPSNTWKTVVTYPQAALAQIAKGKLEAEGIACRLSSPHHSPVFPLPMSRFELQVQESDFAEAIRILNRKAEG